MFVQLLLALDGLIPGVGVTRYLSFRLGAATLTTFLLTIILIPLVAKLARRQGFSDRDDKSDSAELNSLHAAKRSTPILGGLAVVSATLISILAWAHVSNFYVLLTTFVLISLAACGFVDDWVKTFGADKRSGLTPKQKLAWQFATALIFGLLFVEFHGAHSWLPKAFAADHRPVVTIASSDGPIRLRPEVDAVEWEKMVRGNMVEATTIYPPFMKDTRFRLGAPLFLLFAMIVLVGSSNAVNLTDGLDGLAAGSTIFVALTYTVLAYVSGRADWSAYLGIPYVPGAGEIALISASLAGAALGFLWFNCHPAEIFMGDTGSLPIGGVLGAMALITKHDLLLALAGGIFVAEASSVLIQVAVFKATGKRVFRCAPLHHHFEFSGWPETKVVQRAWIVGGLLAMVALTTLKLR